MKYSILAGAVMGFLFLSSQVQGQEKIVVNPVGHYQTNMADLVDVPGVAGVKAVQVKGEVGQYGWCTIDLGRTFTAGQYNIEYTISTQLDNAAQIALYAAADQNQSQITGVHQCARGQAYKLQTAFYSPINFSGIAIKKMSQDNHPGVAVSQITLTDLGRKEFPRLSAYQAVMSYAAPWGLRSGVMEKNKEVGEIEAWLDMRSGVTEPFSMADYLFRVIRVKQLPIETAKIQKTLDTLKANLDKNQLKDIPALLATAENDLTVLQSEVEKKLGAVVCPEKGTDIFTWIKAWHYVGVVGDYEYCEPTAYRAVYPDFQLGLIKGGEKADLFSTWTTSTYRTDRLTAVYSMLTPLTAVDVRKGSFDLGVIVFKAPNAANTPAGKLMAPKGWFALKLQNSLLLFILNHEAQAIEWKGSRLTIDFNKPSAVGYLVLPASMEKKLPDIARFYQQVLLHQPVECVQLQRGDKIEQTFEYMDRTCDWPAIKPLTIAPVPHLAMLSREPGCKFHIKADQYISRSPDKVGYIKNNSTLAYSLPAMPLRHNLGANVFDDTGTTKEMFQELRQHGCQTIRQLTTSQMPWSIKDKKSVEKVKAFIQQRLAWAREIGLKVGIDYHGGWDTSTLKNLPEFIATWKEIISWCQGYQDVVAWYDLLNEPGIFPDQGQPTKPYFEFMRGLVKALRPAAGKTPILVEGVSMANPGGLNYWEDFSDKNIVVGFHDYWPHLFTHQLTVEKGNASYPHAFYPSFMPMMEWTVPSWRNECPAWHYWDRWKRDSVNEPVMRMIIQKGVWADCGEYGVVGYAGDVCKRSGVLWMRHALELYKRMNISHCAFSPAPNSGFTWLVPEFKEETYRFWKQNSK